MIKVGVIGASGYAGTELLRLLLGHPQVQLAEVASRSSAGKQLADVLPQFRSLIDLEFSDLDPQRMSRNLDVVFTAVPHTASMELVPALMAGKARVIDLSADFRLPADIYEQWYKVEHKAPQLTKEAVYGLPELHKEEISKARLVAVPGCYPTSAILGLAPLVDCGWVDTAGIVVAALSGVSGAGRTAKPHLHFPERAESVAAYSPTGHRHIAEMEVQLSRLAGRSVTVSFIPHLIPMNRGIISTITATLSSRLEKEHSLERSLLGLYQEFYQDAIFVQVLPAGELPQTGHVRGSNFCHLAVTADPRAHRVIVVSAIDNLTKGAAGQAVQCMNLMLGLPEDEGLKGAAIHP